MRKLLFPVLIALLLCASVSAQSKRIINLNAVNLADTYTPVRKLSFENMDACVQNDSLSSENKPLKPYSPSAGTLIGEALLGPALGAVIGGGTAGVLYALFTAPTESNRGQDNIAIVIAGGAAGFIAGTGLGVYLIAHADNPNVTYGGTLLGSLIGTGVAVGTGVLLKESKSDAKAAVILIPTIGSMVYANYIAPHPGPENCSSNIDNCRNLSLSYSHKDLYNSTLRYKMNLFTIAF
ncbi:MAG TPA: hypothetical protein VHO03_18945 [Ignavibacteriales bacterium]|nr:hypothetical protein [Ignavibacteriales bacterium]